MRYTGRVDTMETPILTSHGSLIAGYVVVEELGTVVAKPPGLDDLERHYEAVERGEIPPGQKAPNVKSFDSEATALVALKAAARELGANGIINVGYYWGTMSGIAVRIEKALRL